jgi:pimeloyl-CoA synthetase
MASTKLVRKAQRNRAVSRQRRNTIKRLTTRPVIKNVDIEEIKEEFAKKKAAPAPKKETPVKEDPKVEAESKVEEAPQPKTEKSDVAPKASAETKKEEKSTP